MKTQPALALLLIVLVTTVAIPRRTVAADPFDINVILPLTGGGAFLGKSEQISLGVAEERINSAGGISGRPVHFVIQDDETNAQTAVQLLNGVLAKNPAVVMGSTLTAICGAMAPLVKDGPVLWCFSSAYHPGPDGGWGYFSGISSGDSTVGTVRYTRERGWRKIAVIASNDATGQDNEHVLDQALALPENAAESIVAREHFTPSDISVAAQVAHIKDSGAQVVFAMTTGPSFGTILRGLADAGITLPVVSSSANETFAQMKAYASFLPKELYFSSYAAAAPEALPNGPVKRAEDVYQAAFRAKGVQPDTGTNQAWDAAFIIAGAFQKLGANATPAQVRAYLDGLHGFAGTNGEYDFRAYPKHGVGANWSGVQKWDPATQAFVGASQPGGAPLK
ncbi:MAG: ABC transporter substrate-binding protein [Candidatus Lustribacter sp.]|jgi:branched-chain amino acid transport system substrate-binding protein